MFCGYGIGGGLGFGIFGFILMIIFWALIIWAIFAIVRAIAGAGRGDRGWHGHGRYDAHDWRSRMHMGGDDALRTLRDRYARGDISREEYEQRRADLER